MKRIHLFRMLAAASVIAGTIACKDDTPEVIEDFADLTGFETVSISNQAQEIQVKVKTNCDWKIDKGEGNWIDIIPNEGKADTEATVRFVIEENFGDERSIDLSFTAGSVKKEMTLTQAATDFVPSMTVSGIDNSEIKLDFSDKGVFTFTVEANEAWNARLDGITWATVEPASGAEGSTQVTVKTTEANSGLERDGMMVLSAEGVDDIQIKVIQSKFEFTDPVWKWTLDSLHIAEHFDSQNEDIKLNTYEFSDDYFRGVIRFVHTHPITDYYTVNTTEKELSEMPSYIGIRAEKAGTNSLGLSSFGALIGDYWEFECPVSAPVKAGSTMHVRFLVMGNNQSPAFWDGCYLIDDADPVYLHVEERNYKGGGKATKPTWDIYETCSWVLGYDLPGNNKVIAHLIEEDIVLPADINKTFKFRMVVKSTTFSKVSIEWESATSRTFLEQNLSLVSSGAGYEGTEPQIIFEVK